jgi:hypothetical protein
MALLGLWQSKVKYRVRIFDNGLHIMTAIVPDKGQRYITLTVHREIFGLFGEKTRLAFMINPEIKPFIFGRIIELNFDIRDSVQMGDLLDIVPDLVCEINETYKNVMEVQDKTINAEFTVTNPSSTPADKKSDLIHQLTDPIIEEKVTKEPEDERAIDVLIKGGKDIIELSGALYHLRSESGDDKRKKIEKVMALCKRYPKCLYWLPKRLNLDQEIHMLVSQTRVTRCGILPPYYKAQTDALIAEKALTRPKTPEGWQTVVLILGIIGLVVLGIAIIMHGGI